MESSAVPVEPGVPEFGSAPSARTLRGRLLAALCFGFGAFHLYTATFGLLPDLAQRAVHIMFALTISFLLVGATRRRGRFWPLLDYAAAAVAIVTTAYVVIYNDRILMDIGYSTRLDRALGMALVALVLWCAYRTVGLAIALIPGVLIAYALYDGNLGYWSHPPLDAEMLVEVLYLSTRGVFGSIVGVSATIVAAFILFGAILERANVTKTFMDLAMLVAGRRTAGPAKVAVVASSLFGTISGSGAGNAAVTGSFTIPLMVRLGCSPTLAAAVEATAATGGQILPPIMGVGAFLMAEFLGVSYWKVAVAAALPALLYIICIFTGVHFEGRRVGLRPVPRELIPKVVDVVNFRRLGRFVLPVATLLYMIASGRSVMLAAIYASAIVFVLYVFEDFHAGRMGKRLAQMGAALYDGGRALAYIGVLIAAANIAVALVGVTGVGIKLSQLILSLSNGSLLASLLVAAVVALILGCGLPTTPSYVLAAAVVATPLIQAGVSPMGAHLFLFYFACISDITPPICAAVYITAGIAKTPWVPVSFLSVRLGLAKYIVPFVFVYSPALLLSGTPQDVIVVFALCSTGIVALSAAASRYFVHGPLRWPEVLLLGVGGLGVMMPSPEVRLTAGALLLIAYGLHYTQHRGRRTPSRNDTKEEGT